MITGARIHRAIERAPAAAPALVDGDRTLSYGELGQAVSRAAAELVGHGLRCVGLLAENGASWVVLDLACLVAGVTCVPLPVFFTDAQIDHVLSASRVEAVATDDPARILALAPSAARGASLAGLALADLRAGRLPRPSPGAAKVTFTSGTTGAPKGARLSAAAMTRTADALRRATGLGPGGRHLSLLPLPVLLENVGGAYRALLAGAALHVTGLERLGLAGSCGLDAERAAGALAAHRPTSVILVPQQLAALVEHYEQSAVPPPDSLAFVGVGGAAVPAGLIGRARAAGVPAFEGYGLTEACSVVALNTPAADRVGSVGRVLPHLEAVLAADGELLVRGTTADGYLDRGLERVDGWLATGDLGEIDEQGFVHLKGRKRNRIITSFGRNVSPEWVERELEGEPGIGRAAVFGDGEAALVAVVSGGAAEAAVDGAVRNANSRLPDYARVAGWTRAAVPFSAESGQLTPNGRLLRRAIEQRNAPGLAVLRRDHGCGDHQDLIHDEPETNETAWDSTSA